MPKPLDVNRIRQFESASAEKVTASVERWPSREPIRDSQISIKAPLDVIERFKRICKDDRRIYADMLGILMDRYESK